jgi:hypothetical protein
MSWVGVAGLGVNLIGGLVGKKKDKQAANQLQQMGRLWNTSIAGGGGVSGYAGENGAGFSLGDFAYPQFQQNTVANTASDFARQAMFGLPFDVTQAHEALGSQDLDLGAFLRGEQGAGALAGRSLLDAFNPSRTAQGVYESELGLLRQQAAPEEQRQMRSFAQQMFGSGRGAVTGVAGNEGSVGGGRLAAAFGEGLGRADVERQLQARQSGFNAAASEENLLRSAFGRFADMQGLAADFNSARFGRTNDFLTQNYNRSVNNAQLPPQLAMLFQNLAGSGISNALSIGDYGLGVGQFALDNSRIAASARTGAAIPAANLQARSQTAPYQILGGALAQATPVGGGLAELFSRFSRPGGGTQPYVDAPTTSRIMSEPYA